MDLDSLAPSKHLPAFHAGGADDGGGGNDPALQAGGAPAAVLVGGRQAAREIAQGPRLEVVAEDDVGLIADGFLIVRDRPGRREPAQRHSPGDEYSAYEHMHVAPPCLVNVGMPRAPSCASRRRCMAPSALSGGLAACCRRVICPC